MRTLILSLCLSLVPLAAFAAEPTPSPGALPIRGVTVDVQQRSQQAPSGVHIEAPPFAPRMYRAAPAPAAPQNRALPLVSPSPSPTPRP